MPFNAINAKLKSVFIWDAREKYRLSEHPFPLASTAMCECLECGPGMCHDGQEQLPAATLEEQCQKLHFV